MERIQNARSRGLDSSAYREWENIIASHTVEQIAVLLEEETEEGQRIRSSRPFVGPPFVTESERKGILERAFAE